jgi:hypothetical protein
MTKVLLGTVRSSLLGQTFLNDVKDRDDIRIVGPASGNSDLLSSVSSDVAVVLLSLDALETPSACSQLLDIYPELTIIALPAEGKWGFLFRRAMTVKKVELDSVESLLQLIQSVEQE